MTDSTLGAEWDERYASWADQIPDDSPSAVMVEVAGSLTPGTALDVGCGIGANAIWLAAHGWDTTALDVSQVALDRATARGRHAGVDVRWLRGRLEDLAVAPSDFVVAHYPALRHSPGNDAERSLLAAVAPGGTLLVVHHANVELELAKAHGFDPSDYVSHDDVVGALGDEWDVAVEGRRPRDMPAGLDGQHTHDDVIVARRRR
ncbi:class I SAM-dependent methyltransferase [Mycolicibacterium iranicum]|uniref:class I SAM-dependent methyltransferase n=1 Tax=Mycolicibacterium iranicum TaxID=912594 RepID=UPI000465D1F2|nr:class I SAM-dependent methyltransferase [Mycolicibacterium iranicum]